MKSKLFFLTSSLCTSFLSTASPWVNTDDPYLRASINALATANIIQSPVNTYPLMWRGIAEDLSEIDTKKIPESLAFAYRHVTNAMNFAQQSLNTGIKLQAASSNSSFQSFGERHGQKQQLSLFSEVLLDKAAVKLQVNIRHDSPEDQTVTYDGSYAAGHFGNWMLSVEQISYWWGPGKDNALIMSNNARPFPALRISRVSPEPFETPWLSWLGPWQLTTHFGEQEHGAAVPNAKLWGFRVDFRPLPELEIGLSRSAQWGGNGRGEGFSSFWDVVTGKDNVGEVSADEEPGNQLGGIDLRYSTTILGEPIGLYAEIIGEDESGNLPSHTMHLVGADWYFGSDDFLYEAFVEYTDTFIDCGFNGGAGNCAYEHPIFEQGYRRYGRSMGSTYDSDAEVLVLGINGHHPEGWAWFSKFKLIHLNKDGTNNINFNHPLSPNGDQDRIQLDVGIQFPLLKGLAKVQGYYADIDQRDGESSDSVIKASWEYRF